MVGVTLLLSTDLLKNMTKLIYICFIILYNV